MVLYVVQIGIIFNKNKMADIVNYQSAFGTGGELVGGIIQANRADAELKRLKGIKGYGDYEYLTGQQIFDQAKQKAEGLSAEEKAFAQQGISRAATQNFRNFADRNPSMSGIAQAIVNDQSAIAGLSLAAQDAAVRRQSLNTLIPLIGNQANLQETAKTGLEIDTLKQVGMAKQAGLTNAHNSKETIRNSIMSFWGGGSKSIPYDSGMGNGQSAGDSGSNQLNYGNTNTGGGFGTNRTQSGYGGMGQNSVDGFGGNRSGFSEEEYYRQNYPYYFGANNSFGRR